MVGIQNTTASLARCYEGKNRKINYPIMKTFNPKKSLTAKVDENFKDEDTETTIEYNIGDEE